MRLPLNSNLNLILMILLNKPVRKTFQPQAHTKMSYRWTLTVDTPPHSIITQNLLDGPRKRGSSCPLPPITLYQDLVLITILEMLAKLSNKQVNILLWPPESLEKRSRDPNGMRDLRLQVLELINHQVTLDM